MLKKLIHTPEGVRDLYNIECAKKESIMQRIRKVIRQYGYREIQPPSFEYFDIFSKEKGSVSARDMFKFFDRDGDTLVLRPDITPSVARAAAKYYMEEEMPVRLSYCGNTFINHFGYQGRLKEQTQIGAELIGDSSPEADAEIIALMVRSLEHAGLNDFQIEIGNVDFFYGFLKQTNFDEEDVLQLKALIESKNYFGVEGLLTQRSIKSPLRETILRLPELFGGYEVLSTARELANNEISKNAIFRLEKVYQILSAYKVTDHITFDLGMIGNYQYYTGVIFRGITYGTGENIVTGGRYDKLLAQYGKNSCSIGFAIRIDQLVTAMERQKLLIPYEICETLLLYDPDMTLSAIQNAEKLRAQGHSLSLILKEKSLSDYISYAKRNNFTELLYWKSGNQEPEVLLTKEGV